NCSTRRAATADPPSRGSPDGSRSELGATQHRASVLCDGALWTIRTQHPSGCCVTARCGRSAHSTLRDAVWHPAASLRFDSSFGPRLKALRGGSGFGAGLRLAVGAVCAGLTPALLENRRALRPASG